jgi:hypothetical protein
MANIKRFEDMEAKKSPELSVRNRESKTGNMEVVSL